MKATKLALAVCTLILGIAAQNPVQAQTTETEYRTIFTGILQRQAAALNRKDISGFLKTRTADHVAIDINGTKRSTKQAKAKLDLILPLMRSFHLNPRIDKVTIYKDKVTAQVASGSTMVLWNPRTHRDSVMQGQHMEEYTYRRVKGQWLESSVRELKVKMWMDGQPIPYNGQG